MEFPPSLLIFRSVRQERECPQQQNRGDLSIVGHYHVSNHHQITELTVTTVVDFDWLLACNRPVLCPTHNHLMSWDTMCLLKAHSGLGLHLARDSNLFLLIKVGWRLEINLSSLSCEILQGNYLHNFDFKFVFICVNASFIWRGILKCRTLFNLSRKWVIRNGINVSFQNNMWVGDSLFIRYAFGVVDNGLLSRKVVDFIGSHKEQQFDSL